MRADKYIYIYIMQTFTSKFLTAQNATSSWACTCTYKHTFVTSFLQGTHITYTYACIHIYMLSQDAHGGLFVDA